MLISTSSQKALKVLHLLAVSAWFGGCIAVITLVLASSSAREGGELFGILNGVRYVNVIVVVYLGAFSTLFTGLAYSLCTNRGFFRYLWITLKWIITVVAIVGGAFILGPRSTALLEAADAMGLAALETPGYIRMHTLVLMLLGFECLLLVSATVLSVYRPGEQQPRGLAHSIRDLLTRSGPPEESRPPAALGRLPEPSPPRKLKTANQRKMRRK